MSSIQLINPNADTAKRAQALQITVNAAQGLQNVIVANNARLLIVAGLRKQNKKTNEEREKIHVRFNVSKNNSKQKTRRKIDIKN